MTSFSVAWVAALHTARKLATDFMAFGSKITFLFPQLFQLANTLEHLNAS